MPHENAEQPSATASRSPSPSPCEVCGDAEVRRRVTVYVHGTGTRNLGRLTASVCAVGGVVALATNGSFERIVLTLLGILVGIMAGEGRHAYACQTCGALTECSEKLPPRD